jgi:hypothetical protein
MLIFNLYRCTLHLDVHQLMHQLVKINIYTYVRFINFIKDTINTFTNSNVCILSIALKQNCIFVLHKYPENPI